MAKKPKKKKLKGMGGEPRLTRLPNDKGKSYSNPGSHSRQRKGSK